MNSKLLFCLIFAFLFRLIFLWSIPGLHVDEAILGEMSHDILTGKQFYFYGMNQYTGATIQYLRVPFMFLFGSNLFSIRLVNVLFGVATVYFVYLLFSDLFKEAYGLRAAWIFAVIPWHVIWSRIAWEITTFPFFIVLILYCVICKKSWKWHLFGWLVATTALFTHIIFIAFIIPLAGYVFFKKKAYSWCILTLLPVVIPLLFTEKQSGVPIGSGLNFSYVLKSAFGFLSHLDGTSLYLKTTGEVALFVIPFISASLLLSIIYFKKRDYLTFTWFTLASVLIITFFANLPFLRHYIIPLACASLVLCYLFFNSKKVLFYTFIFLSIFYVAINFYYTFYITGGSTSMFEHITINDTSAYFVDLTPLIHCVNKLHPKEILVPDKQLYKTLKKPFIPDWWIVKNNSIDDDAIIVAYSYSFDSFPQDIIKVLFDEPCQIKNFRVLMPRAVGNIRKIKFR